MKNGTLALATLGTTAVLVFAAPGGHAQAPTAPPGTTASARPAGRPARPGRQQEHLRPLRRAPRPLHLRRHLGRAKTRRSRTRAASATTCVAALQAAQACPCCAGRAAASPTSITGGTASARASKRPSMINTHWGGVVENNTFGTHEFIDLVRAARRRGLHLRQRRQRHASQEMMEWVEYMTSDADSPMANLRRQNGREKPWQRDVLRRRQRELGLRRQHAPRVLRRRVPALPDLRASNYGEQPIYADRLRRERRRLRVDRGADGAARPAHMDGLSLHYYTLPTGNWDEEGRRPPASTRASGTRRCASTLRMDELLTKHAAIMDKHDPREARRPRSSTSGAPGTTSSPAPSPASSTSRTRCATRSSRRINLNIFHKHADRVRMANIAQMVNVLQAMILTDKEKMLLTPTYHVFEMFKVHQGGTFLPVELQSPDYAFGRGEDPDAERVGVARGRRLGRAPLARQQQPDAGRDADREAGRPRARSRSRAAS